MFQLNYARPENWGQLRQAVEQGWRHGGATLIELQVPPSDGAETLRHLVQQMAGQ
ncbi:2-succinyl-5-enolpyruvyl-6-hydroxy-3-cyclohexene-1-carboxylate synthase [compost metagenome]